MESNSDKQLRDKLNSAEFPFDPQAWEKMEAMLDQKKKRRGFFWWWTGGVAALLVVGLIGYEIGVNSNRNPVITSAQRTIMEQSTPERDPSRQASALETSSSTEKPASNSSNVDHTTAKPHMPVANNNTDSKGELNKPQARSAASSSEENAFIFPDKESKQLSAKEVSREKRKKSLRDKANAGAPNSVVVKSDKIAVSEEVAALEAVYAMKDREERIEMDRREGLLTATDETLVLSKEEDDALPKSKKKVFHYSLGVIGNLTATTLGRQENEAQRVPFFYNKPSYAVGFTHEFLFLNRIAISNSILYAQTGFRRYNPAAPDDSAATRSYSSAISELQIPLGIKAYPVSKRWFRFSIAAGIVNHIKLKEVFTVEKEIPPVIPNNLNYESNFVSVVADNPFVGNTKANSLQQDDLSSPEEQAEYFGLGGLRRYYASFYASAGVEFIAKKHFIFFTEPMFYMSLNKIGLQDKRKYNLGANAGFKYQF